MLVAFVDALHQLADGFRLVTGGLEWGLEFKVHGSSNRLFDDFEIQTL